MGIITRPDGHPIIVTAFLTASPADKKHRDALFAETPKTYWRHRLAIGLDDTGKVASLSFG
ncbi:hypothetical protein [Rhodanobacter sp. MP7CTX1]|uniref:hypothetical protein n=1 Tax=Rhodanobacter sp. MP7CTX1 TaxID=2723084 RepID=UPI001618AD7E|nr:hypothetical protein [Rhodanobacter sp. MP7CTX1]MBB6188385.1 hypothetical protein [Rhodanobacter sp. MP7CTX1]